jgi:hypothetical protein
MTFTKEDRFEDLFRRTYDELSRFVLFKVHTVSVMLKTSFLMFYELL